MVSLGFGHFARNAEMSTTVKRKERMLVLCMDYGFRICYINKHTHMMRLGDDKCLMVRWLCLPHDFPYFFFFFPISVRKLTNVP